MPAQRFPALVLGALALLGALTVPLATAQVKEGQTGAVWELGSKRQGEVLRTTVTVANASCRGRRSFEISILGDAEKFLRLDGPSRLERIRRGESKSVPAVIDLRHLDPGTYDDGRIEIRCVDCPPTCRQDYHLLRIHLVVLPAEGETSSGGGSTGGEPGAAPVGSPEAPPGAAPPGEGASGGERPERHGEALTAGAERRCVQSPSELHISDWDLIADLHRNRALGSSPAIDCDLNQIREDLGAELSRIEKTIEDLDRVIDAYGGVEKYGLRCEPEDQAQTFPPFPGEAFFLSVDLCRSQQEDRQLIDLVDPNADPAAVDRWCRDFTRAFENFGRFRPNDQGRSLLTYYRQAIQTAMGRLGAAGEDFKGRMDQTLSLRYSTSKGWNKFADFMITAVLSSAGGPVAWCTALGQTLLTEATRAASGGDEKAVLGAKILGSIASLGIGSLSGAAEAGFAESLQGEVLKESGLSGAEALLGSALEKETMNISFSMAMLDDDTWNKTLKKLREQGYFRSAFDQLEEHREELQQAVKAQLTELCSIREELKRLLPALKKAHAEASERLESRSWRREFEEQVKRCTCCRYSDGSGPDLGCRFNVPPF